MAGLVFISIGHFVKQNARIVTLIPMSMRR